MINVLVVDDALADWPCVRADPETNREHDPGSRRRPAGAGAAIEQHHPDIVLTDLHMPEMNGLELVTAVKEKFPDIPVLLMTAKGSEDIAAQALRQAAASYVPKRRLADDLVRTIMRQCCPRRGTNATARC